MNKKVIIAAVVALIVVTGAVAAYLFTQNAASPSKNTSTDSSDVKNAAQTITYTSDGFTPSTITVKSGDIVAIKNTSTKELEFESDPHPVHTDNTELNVGFVATGQTLTFKVITKGEYGIHNHVNAGHTATIIVK